MKEKANKTSAVPRPVKKVKGTVLFTVVCVMMVLVVFLMGTLTLAATANKRALTNYQQEQTEYTAKAVLDAVLAKANDTTDTALKDAIAGIHTSGTPLDLDVTIPGDTAQETSHVTITDTGRTQWLYSTADAAWREIPIYNMSVTVRSQTTAAATTYNAVLAAAAAVNPTTTTQTNPPALGSGGGGAFVSIGKLEGEFGTGGYVSGGTYIGLANKDAGTDPTTVDFWIGGSQESQIDAPGYIYGNFTMNKVTQLHFTRPDEYFAVMGNFAMDNSGLETSFAGWDWCGNYDYNSLPKIYVGGTFNIGGKCWIGDDDVPVNIFASKIEWDAGVDDTGIGFHGDMYMFDPNETSHIKAFNNNPTELYSWTAHTLNGDVPTTHLGSLLSAGSLDMSTPDNGNFSVSGDVRVSKDLTISNTPNGKRIIVGSDSEKGDVVVGGTLVNNGILEVHGDLIAGSVINNGTIEIKNGGSVKIVKNGAGDPNWTGNAPNGATPVGVDASTAGAGATTTTEKWYEMTTPFVDDWGDWNVRIPFTVHTRVNGGAWESKSFGEWDPNGFQTTVSKADAPTQADVLPWLLANNTRYQEMAAHNSEATALSTSNTASYYELKTVYGKEVYPAKYVKGVMMDVTDPTDPTKTIQVDQMPNKVFTEPSASSYTGSYISNTTQLETYGYYQLSGPLKDTNGNTIEANYEGYKIPVYKIGTGDMTNKVHDQFLIKKPADGSTSTEWNIDKGTYYEINSSCVLSGDFDKPVYINGAPFVVLDNCTISPNLLINDTSQSTIYIAGSFETGSIITKDWVTAITGGFNPGGNYSYNIFTSGSGSLDLPQFLNASDSRYPNVMIYAQNHSSVNITSDRALVTAIVRAPYCNWYRAGGSQASMTVNYMPTNGTPIKYGQDYDGTSPTGRNFENSSIGLIGELIADDIGLGTSTRWGLLYVTDGTHSTTPPPISSTFVPGSTQQTVVTSGGSAEYFSFMYYNLS
ncbi:MAG: hypothetical protein IKI21_02955 [Oscillospiraceae bacterium]|nr:hypothetical protein [Oscillospiraceae bacterium]